jgi:dTDP-glucose pyrophosphorylase
MFLSNKFLKSATISKESKIIDAIKSLNKSTIQIVLVEDRKKNFFGTITDGDIRRALVKGKNLNSKIDTIIKKKPYILEKKEDLKYVQNILHKKNIKHLPIIKKRKIVGIYSTILPVGKSKILENRLVIMSGGFGKRLGSLTKKTPKGMLVYKNKPLLEHIILLAKENGIKNIYLSVYFLKKKIINYFKNGKKLNLNIKYLNEKHPLGTIGSIRYLKKEKKPFAVINCDVISNINFDEMFNFHKKSKSLITVGLKEFSYENPYGVIKNLRNKFLAFEEKPIINFKINAGAYIFNNKVIDIVKKNNIRDVHNLIDFCQNKKFKISVFPIIEDWTDFGLAKKILRSK